ncbi:unnamed protein product [Fraxinus pennsylvanica]|uniref:Uncharacterized protein n=1 Tax=Fraxinus pennsylvanica TaxID=56036 RepID=A0AAD2DYK7_9LAMI|nr:unnamed protein product [Fraxinus pennsylvanica]
MALVQPNLIALSLILYWLQRFPEGFYLAGNKISEVEALQRLLKLNVLVLRYSKISTNQMSWSTCGFFTSYNPGRKSGAKECRWRTVEEILIKSSSASHLLQQLPDREPMAFLLTRHRLHQFMVVKVKQLPRKNNPGAGIAEVVARELWELSKNTFEDLVISFSSSFSDLNICFNL